MVNVRYRCVISWFSASDNSRTMIISVPGLANVWARSKHVTGTKSLRQKAKRGKRRRAKEWRVTDRSPKESIQWRATSVQEESTEIKRSMEGNEVNIEERVIEFTSKELKPGKFQEMWRISTNTVKTNAKFSLKKSVRFIDKFMHWHGAPRIDALMH